MGKIVVLIKIVIHNSKLFDHVTAVVLIAIIRHTTSNKTHYVCFIWLFMADLSEVCFLV